MIKDTNSTPFGISEIKNLLFYVERYESKTVWSVFKKKKDNGL